jgi:hypothetical protein
MDEIRRPYRGERRNYALPQDRPAEPNLTDLRTAPPQPVHQAPAHHQPAQAGTYAPTPVNQPAYHHPQPHHQPAAAAHPAPHPAHHRKKTRRISLSLPIITAAVLAIVAVAGGFYLLKPKAKPTVTPTQLASKSSFSFYYPSPLPGGYSYNQEISTFQGGQAYYMLANSKKHMIIHEQAAKSNSLDLTSITNPKTLDSSAGRAAIGTTAGQASAVVLANSTLITIDSTGSVPQADIVAVINNLRVLPR